MTSTEVYGNTLLIEIAVKDDRYLGLTLYNKNTVAIALNNLTLDEIEAIEKGLAKLKTVITVKVITSEK